MTRYWNELKHITDGINQLRNICSSLHDAQTCNLTILQFEEIITDMEGGNELLQYHERYRRSPLDNVGNIANSLFGVLDSAYAEKMAQIIDNVENNQQRLLDLLRNQTSIVDSTVNIFNQTQEAMRLQIQRLKIHVNGLQLEAKEQKLMEGFNALSTQLILRINNYQKCRSPYWTLLLTLIKESSIHYF